MKKLNYMLLGLAGLALASCSQDDFQGPAQNGDGNVKITVNLPSDALGTRADFGNGLTSKKLQYAVFNVTELEAGATPTVPTFMGTADFGTSTTTTLNLNLLNGKTYQVAFFAQSEASMGTEGADDAVYVFDGTTITVNYGKMTSDANNSDAYDCFYNVVSTGVISSSNNQFSAKLYRPVAQVNWGASDIDGTDEITSTFGENGEYIMTELSVNEGTPLPTSLDVFTGQLTKNFSGSIGKFEIPEGHAYPVDPTTYDYVAIQYILAGVPGEISGTTSEPTIYDFTLNISNSGDDTVEDYDTDVVVANAPIQANYQTNIYGALLSNNTTFNIEVMPGFAGKLNLILTAEDFSEALSNGGEIGLGADITTSEPLSFTSDTELELNGHTLNVNHKNSTSILNGNNVSIKGGNLNLSGNGYSSMDIEVENGTLTLDGVNMTTTGAGFNCQRNTGELIIKNSTITAPNLAISTNADGVTESSEGSYGKNGKITLESSTIIAKGGTPLLNNVPNTIEATDCTFIGGIQCALIRGGSATFTDCTFNFTHSMAGNPYRLQTWGTGNTACLAPIVGGNLDYKNYAEGQAPSYDYPTTIVLDGTTTITIDGVNAAYTPAMNFAAKDKNTVTLTYTPENLNVTYANGVERAEGYYEIEYVTTGITVNGTPVTPETPGYIGK